MGGVAFDYPDNPVSMGLVGFDACSFTTNIKGRFSAQELQINTGVCMRQDRKTQSK